MASPESLELAQAWLAKAGSDLETAILLITGDQKHLDTGSYHCQQAAEKELKGWLTAKEIVFPKTHSLEEILALCIPSNPGFAGFREHCEQLTPLVHEFRYPSQLAEPDPPRAASVLQLAGEVYSFCKQQLRSAT